MTNDKSKMKIACTFGMPLLLLGMAFPSLAVLASPTFLVQAQQQPLETEKKICPADIKPAIDAIISRPEFQRSRWGILVQNLKSNGTIYNLDGDKYFLPASNAKLLTSAAALFQLGAEFRLRTPAYSTGEIPNLKTLQIVGKGDPTITTKKLRALAQQLQRKGVRQIDKLIVEDSYFKISAINPTWEWEDLFFYYAAPVNRLILNQNAVTLSLFPQQVGQPLKVTWSDAIAGQQWQVNNQTITAPAGTDNTLKIQGKLGQPILEISGNLAVDSEPDVSSISIPEPAAYFLATFRRLLADEGIAVKEGLVLERESEEVTDKELAFIISESLTDLIKIINQDSNNLFTESLLNILVAETQATSKAEAIKQTLTELGVDPETYNLVDGSGLSRHNLVSPAALVQALKLMAKTPAAKIYKDSLAVAGVSGTLEGRFKNTPVAGILQGKTGTLTGVSSLSGYLDVAEYQPLVFSIMLNQANRPASDLRAAIDEIVLLLSQLKFCQSAGEF
jgi:D-alanyl-D-alanine carboxypeptidase/D-alanyl-D-alanine-endopeptidase (penicillin-binding protein 4)